VPDARGALVWATDWLSAGRGVEPYSYLPVWLGGVGGTGPKAAACSFWPPFPQSALIRPRPPRLRWATRRRFHPSSSPSAICTILCAKLRTSTILNGAVERLLKAAYQALRDQIRRQQREKTSSGQNPISTGAAWC